MRGGGEGNRNLGVSGVVLSLGSGRLWVSKSREELRGCNARRPRCQTGALSGPQMSDRNQRSTADRWAGGLRWSLR